MSANMPFKPYSLPDETNIYARLTWHYVFFLRELKIAHPLHDSEMKQGELCSNIIVHKCI